LALIPSLTLVYPYYDNPEMLREHQRVWRALPRAVADRIEVIVVDDASPRWPAVDAFADAGITARLFRIETDIPWNWLEARNIGAHHARADWLLLTDIDHVAPAATLAELLRRLDAGAISPRHFYTLDRVSAPGMTPYKPHPDSYLMPRDLFWRAGGYDEFFAGHYGTSGIARRRFETAGTRGHLIGLPLVRYGRAVVADANTTTLPRKDRATQVALKRLWAEKQASGDTAPLHFRQPYHRVR
jgi:hypothetical protein